MTMTIRNLSVLNYAQGFTLWHYKAGSLALADVLAPGYFATAGDMFATGDMVLISARDGGAQMFVTEARADHVSLTVMSSTPRA